MKNIISREAMILEALTHGENYGMGLIELITQITNKEIKILTGALQRKLWELTEQKLVKHTRSEKGLITPTRNREYFELTEAGKIQADANRKIMAALFRLKVPK